MTDTAQPLGSPHPRSELLDRISSSRGQKHQSAGRGQKTGPVKRLPSFTFLTYLSLTFFFHDHRSLPWIPWSPGVISRTFRTGGRGEGRLDRRSPDPGRKNLPSISSRTLRGVVHPFLPPPRPRARFVKSRLNRGINRRGNRYRYRV